MKKDYIFNLSEAYVIDNQLYKENLTADELCESFYGLLKEIRIEQPYLYESVVEANKFEQQLIFKNFFDASFKPNTFFTEDIDLENLDESITDFLFSGSWEAWAARILVYILYTLFKRPLSKVVMQMVTGLFSGINYLGKGLSSVGKSSQLAYAIIQKNAKKCYQECGYNPEKDTTPSDYMMQHSKSGIVRTAGRYLSTEEEEAKMSCLRECYLSTQKEVAKLAAQSYFSCLKSTGDLSRLPIEREFSAYQQVLSNSGLSQSCDQVASYLKKALDVYSDILELVYHEQPTEIRRMKNELMSEIYKIQTEASGGRSQSSIPNKQSDFRSQGRFDNKTSRPPFQKR